MQPYTKEEINELLSDTFKCGAWPESRYSKIRSARFFMAPDVLKTGKYLIIDNNLLAPSQAESLLLEMNKAIQTVCDEKGVAPPSNAFFGSFYTDRYLEKNPGVRLHHFSISSEGIDFLKSHDLHPDLGPVMQRAAEMEQGNVQQLESLKQKLEKLAQLPACQFTTALRITGDEVKPEYTLTITVPVSDYAPPSSDKELDLRNVCAELNEQVAGLVKVEGSGTKYHRDGVEKGPAITFSAHTPEALLQAFDKLQNELQPAFRAVTRQAALLQEPGATLSREKRSREKGEVSDPNFTSDAFLEFAEKTINESRRVDGGRGQCTTDTWLRHLVDMADGKAADGLDASQKVLRQKRAERVLSVIAKDSAVYAELIGDMRGQGQDRTAAARW